MPEGLARTVHDVIVYSAKSYNNKLKSVYCEVDCIFYLLCTCSECDGYGGAAKTILDKVFEFNFMQYQIYNYIQAGTYIRV